MTCVILDAKNKVAYSDSCVTTTDVTTGKESFSHDGEKILKHKNGSLIAVTWGNFNIAIPKLKSLGFKVKNKHKYDERVVSNGSSETCGIAMMNSDNETIVHIYSYIREDNTIGFRHKTLENCNVMWAGSGADEQGIVNKLMHYNKHGLKIGYDKMIKAASLVDKFTDDRVQEVRL